MACIFLLAFAALWRQFGQLPRSVSVPPLHKGVILSPKSAKVVETGLHWILPGRELVAVDLRPTPFEVSRQETQTADGKGLRLSLGGEYRVVDPVRFLTESSGAWASFYLEVRQALRTAAGEHTINSFESNQLLLRMKELLVPRAAQLGIELTQLELYEAVASEGVHEA